MAIPKVTPKTDRLENWSEFDPDSPLNWDFDSVLERTTSQNASVSLGDPRP
jgi:hypothetical protein